MKWLFNLTLLAAVGLLVVSTASADVVLLKTGGRVEGNVLNAADASSAGFYLVETTSGGVLKLSRSQVERVERKSEEELKYEELLTKMPNTADGHWKMAEWCVANGLKRQREYHLEQIIKLDPDHEEARHGLGYGKIDDRWVRMDDHMREQGYVRYKNSWRLPMDVMIEQRDERIDLAQKKWRKDMKRWQGWFGRRQHAEAIANFKSIDDPLAALGLSEMLEDESATPPMKLLYIEALGKLDSSTARTALIKASIEDDTDMVRDAALDQLQKNGRQQAVSVFIRGLDPKQQTDNVKINRAAVGLARMGDPQAVRPLIESLITEHKIMLPGGTPSGGGLGLGLGFGRDGSFGGSFGAGSKPKLVLQKVQNENVLHALRMLSGESFGFDQEVWRRWYIETNTPKTVNLRRDGS